MRLRSFGQLLFLSLATIEISAVFIFAINFKRYDILISIAICFGFLALLVFGPDDSKR